MSWRGSIDDSSLSGGRPVPSHSNELKTMTLDRRKKKIQPLPAEDAPPPPVRSHSRRFESSSLTTTTHSRSQPSPQSERRAKGLVSSIASTMETATTKRSKPPARLPPKKTETEPIVPPKAEPTVPSKSSIKRRPSQKNPNQVSGFLSAKAQLQAKMEGTSANIRDEPKLPPKEIATRPNDIKRNYEQSVQEPPPLKPSKLPPKLPRRYSPQPANNRDSDLSSSGSGVFRIKESSSTESLRSNDPPPPPLAAPSLPPRIVSKSEPAANKIARSQSMRRDIIKPPPIEPTHRRNSIDHEPDFLVTQDSQTVSIHNTPRVVDTQTASLQQPSGSMDFSTLISKGAHFFPTQVRVCKGHLSSICESFSKYDIIQLHFVKHAKVGVIKDEFSEEQYTLPLSSSMEFGIMYEAEGADVSQYIPRVEDLMALKPLPVVVLATKPYNGGAPEKSIEENEILFLKKVTKPILGKSRVLEACTAEGMIKKLSAKCEGDFSIHPMHIKITLSTLVQHSIPLPQRVYLLPDPTDATQEYLSDNMTQQPVCLESLQGVTSVICTIKGGETIMDVSKDLGIQVEAEEISEQDRQILADTTLRLHNEFNPTTLSYVIDKATEREYALQCLLNQQLLNGQEMDGVHLQIPSILSHPSHPSHNTPVPTAESVDATSVASSEGLDPYNADYEDIGTALATLSEEDNSRLNKVIEKKKEVSKFFKKLKKTTVKEKKKTSDPKTSDPPYEDTTFDTKTPPPTEPPTLTQATSSQDSYEPVCGDTEEVGDYSDVRIMNTHFTGLKKATETDTPSSQKETESNYVQMNSKIVSIMTELNTLKQQVHNLTLTVEALRGSRGQASTVEQQSVNTTATPSQPNKAEEDEMSRNREFLRTLSHSQVLDMFDKMNMSDYKSGFEQQLITGEQLLGLDDKAVKERFGITRSYHRMKLMRVISGAVRAIV